MPVALHYKKISKHKNWHKPYFFIELFISVVPSQSIKESLVLSFLKNKNIHLITENCINNKYFTKTL